jgi:hypothetical protein
MTFLWTLEVVHIYASRKTDVSQVNLATEEKHINVSRESHCVVVRLLYICRYFYCLVLAGGHEIDAKIVHIVLYYRSTSMMVGRWQREGRTRENEFHLMIEAVTYGFHGARVLVY